MAIMSETLSDPLRLDTAIITHLKAPHHEQSEKSTWALTCLGSKLRLDN